MWRTLSRWLRSKGKPRYRWRDLGEVRVSSRCIVLADPQYIDEPLRVPDVPNGRYPVKGDLLCYPEGGCRVANVSIKFAADRPDTSESLGQVAVDSARIIIADAEDCKRHWTETGSDRIGVILIAKNDNVLRLLQQRFGFQVVRVSGIRAEIVGPVSESLERDILAYLTSFPEYAQFPYMHFYVQTNNTFERMNFLDEKWATVPIGNSEEPKLFTCETGWGDGCYEVRGYRCQGQLVSLEIPFMDVNGRSEACP